MRVGLAGYGDVATGLGQLNARFWRKLPFSSRLIAKHRRLGHGPPPPSTGEKRVVVPPMFNNAVSDWLDAVDVVAFFERPASDDLPRIARNRGKRLVCFPMPEWLPAGLPWLDDMDLFVAFTNQCFDHCRTIGIGGKTVRFDCPLDLDELPFRRREVVNDVVFLNGWGGVHHRKGWPDVQQLLKDCPGIVRVKSQEPLDGHGGPAPCPAALYADADCVLVPGRFDGLGLTVLEAMASGCPVLATDCQPYKEFVERAYADLADACLIEVAKVKRVEIWSHAWDCHIPSVADARMTIRLARQWSPALVSALSVRGRRYVEEFHGDSAWGKVWRAICGA